jgi:multidrug efflux pump subunit AcrA (membrane-fusion protein)
MTDLETAEANAKVAEASLNAAEAQVSQAEASLNQTKVNLGLTVITAPVDGVVISRSVDVGQTVAASMQALKISRSVRSSRFSFRRRASSSRSAVVKPVRPFVRSARARFTHSRSAVPVRSKARAAARTLLPSSRTRRTACSKSSVNWRRARRGLALSPIVDIVIAFPKMSTKSDQAHPT